MAMLATWKAGGCFLPLDPKSPSQRLQHIIQAITADVILTSNTHEKRCRELGCRPWVINAETTSTLMTEEYHSSTINTNNAAYVLFTSGTAGVAKGVVMEHQTLFKNIAVVNGSRVMQFCAYTFDVMLLDIFCTLISGGCVCVPSYHQRINDLTGSIQDFQVNTTWFTTPLSRIVDPDTVPGLRRTSWAARQYSKATCDARRPKYA
ncbi:HC-toxin synthetase 3 [Colletotrichum chlorophyti]|uniref:HC-toxin synthetase 3 n=1 Tax=Colletotrichum chlorophyti TaxID=708187 RepID=A0A1Q8RUU0_9PEZI|nr:HC-toxin synthetase 3 [Colletotrichum chlorophyti]